MSNQKLKDKLLKEKKYECELCKLSDWMGKPICLELDHIDGNNKNNELINLRLLCPNCHSQTDTFRGRNINGSQKVSDEDLLKALEETKNIRQALIKVNLTPKGANYKRAAILLNQNYSKTIDTKNSQFGTVWINNGVSNKKIKKGMLEEYLAVGWMKGRIVDVKPPGGKGRIWITNGLQNKFIKTSEIPANWWKGRSQFHHSK